ncbi:MAG: response regulator [Ferruginibacter sp.]
MNKNRAKILLVEDNEGDIVLTLEALRQVNMTTSIQVVRDGEEALEYLKKQGKYQHAETPNLILLDINLPRVDGKEVLLEIKNDKDLMAIPVVMLTTSESEKDILYSYQHHANCYITKPGDFTKLIDMVQKLNDFWLTIAQLPE